MKGKAVPTFGMNIKRSTSIVGIAVAGMIAVTGCGAGTKLPAGVAARTGLTGAVEVVGNGPVDTLVAIDRTAIMHGRRDLALQYKLAAVAALDATIRRGGMLKICLLYTSPSPRDRQKSRMPSSA